MTLSVMVACGGGGGDDDDDVNHVEDPQPAAGGGVSGGSIRGELNVFVIDDTTDAPISGAAVRVGAADAAEPLTGTTDAAGYALFENADLSGGQEITVTKSGYRASSWLGADGAVVTIPLASTTAPTVQTATVSGTIAGWDSLPNPAANHITLGVVLFSFTEELGDPANEIEQPPGNMGIPPNACYKTVTPIPLSECDWSLVTRVGPQSHYALIVDLDTKGTQSGTDDTFTVIGFAGKGGIDLTAGQTVTGEVLDMVGGAPIDMTVSFPAIPGGLDQISAIPLVRKGDELFPLAFPGLTPAAPSGKVPPLAGVFAGGQYDVIVSASTDVENGPNSLSIVSDVQPGGGTVSLGELLPLPSGLMASGDTYSFQAVSGANLHIAAFVDASGDEVWNVALLDGRTSFTLPALTPDPLPAGALELHVSAISLPGFDPKAFDLDSFIDTIAKAAEGHLDFTH